MDESSAIMDESSEHLFILEQSGSELKKNLTQWRHVRGNHVLQKSPYGWFGHAETWIYRNFARRF